jgi:hypothetical protein
MFITIPLARIHLFLWLRLMLIDTVLLFELF